MKKLLFLLVILLLVLSSIYSKPKLTPRLDIDPALCGLWKLWGSSSDGGVTVTPHDGEFFCRVTASKVTFSVGLPLIVSSVYILETDDGRIGNVIQFDNGVNWVITSTSPGYFLVEVSNTSSFTETFRVLISVD